MTDPPERITASQILEAEKVWEAKCEQWDKELEAILDEITEPILKRIEELMERHK